MSIQELFNKQALTLTVIYFVVNALFLSAYHWYQFMPGILATHTEIAYNVYKYNSVKINPERMAHLSEFSSQRDDRVEYADIDHEQFGPPTRRLFPATLLRDTAASFQSERLYASGKHGHFSGDDRKALRASQAGAGCRRADQRKASLARRSLIYGAHPRYSLTPVNGITCHLQLAEPTRRPISRSLRHPR